MRAPNPAFAPVGNSATIVPIKEAEMPILKEANKKGVEEGKRSFQKL
jgi:hypothetical protein